MRAAEDGEHLKNTAIAKQLGVNVKILSFLIFIPLQTLMIPFALIGVLWTAYKQVLVSKKLGTSQTAIEVLNGRWTMHVFGMRQDIAAAKLANKLPNTSTLGLWLVLFPLWLKYKISGSYFAYPILPVLGKESIAELVSARTTYLDHMIKRVIKSTEQFVVMGAGYDTRTYDPALFKQTFFELDHHTTQDMKKSWLAKAGVDSDHVNFVALDFSQDDLFEKLSESGFDQNKPSVFLWEGVTLYLSESDVKKMLRTFKQQAAPNSVLLVDFYAERFIKMMDNKAAASALDLTNEGLTFGLPLETNESEVFNEFIESQGLIVGETYYLGSQNKKGCYAVISEIRRPK